MSQPFSSISHPLTVDRSHGRLAEEKKYEAHVEQLMRQVLFTNPGERINRPDFGCGLRRMVFAPNSDACVSLVQVTILQALEKWLGNVLRVVDVQAKAAEEVLRVRITYRLKARAGQRHLNVEVTH